jgi:hypothetical protein
MNMDNTSHQASMSTHSTKVVQKLPFVTIQTKREGKQTTWQYWREDLAEEVKRLSDDMLLLKMKDDPEGYLAKK